MSLTDYPTLTERYDYLTTEGGLSKEEADAQILVEGESADTFRMVRDDVLLADRITYRAQRAKMGRKVLGVESPGEETEESSGLLHGIFGDPLVDKELLGEIWVEDIKKLGRKASAFLAKFSPHPAKVAKEAEQALYDHPAFGDNHHSFDREQARQTIKRWEVAQAQQSFDEITADSRKQAEEELTASFQEENKKKIVDLLRGRITQEDYDAHREVQLSIAKQRLGADIHKTMDLANALFYIDEEGEEQVYGTGGTGYEGARNKVLGWSAVAGTAIYSWPFFLKSAAILGTQQALKSGIIDSEASAEHRRKVLQHKIARGNFETPSNMAENWWEGVKHEFSAVDAAGVSYDMIIQGKNPYNAAKALTNINEQMAEQMSGWSWGGLARGIGHWSGDALNWYMAGQLAHGLKAGTKVMDDILGAAPPGVKEKWLKQTARGIGTRGLDNLVTFNAVNIMKGDFDHLLKANLDALAFSLFFPINHPLSQKLGWLGSFAGGFVEGATVPYWEPVAQTAANIFREKPRDVRWPTTSEVGMSGMEFAGGQKFMSPTLGIKWMGGRSALHRAATQARGITPGFNNSRFIYTYDLTMKTMADIFAGQAGSASVFPSVAGLKRAASNFGRLIQVATPDVATTEGYGRPEGTLGEDGTRRGPNEFANEVDLIKRIKSRVGRILSNQSQFQLDQALVRAEHLLENSEVVNSTPDGPMAAKLTEVIKALKQAMRGEVEGMGDQPRFATEDRTAQMLLRTVHEAMDHIAEADGQTNPRQAFAALRQARFDALLENKSVEALRGEEERISTLVLGERRTAGSEGADRDTQAEEVTETRPAEEERLVDVDVEAGRWPSVIEGIRGVGRRKHAHIPDHIKSLNLSPEDAQKLKEEIERDGDSSDPVLGRRQRDRAIARLEDIIGDRAESTEGQQTPAEGPARDAEAPVADAAKPTERAAAIVEGLKTAYKKMKDGSGKLAKVIPTAKIDEDGYIRISFKSQRSRVSGRGIKTVLAKQYETGDELLKDLGITDPLMVEWFQESSGLENPTAPGAYAVHKIWIAPDGRAHATITWQGQGVRSVPVFGTKSAAGTKPLPRASKPTGKVAAIATAIAERLKTSYVQMQDGSRLSKVIPKVKVDEDGSFSITFDQEHSKKAGQTTRGKKYQTLDQIIEELGVYAPDEMPSNSFGHDTDQREALAALREEKAVEGNEHLVFKVMRISERHTPRGIIRTATIRVGMLDQIVDVSLEKAAPAEARTESPRTSKPTETKGDPSENIESVPIDQLPARQADKGPEEAALTTLFRKALNTIQGKGYVLGDPGKNIEAKGGHAAYTLRELAGQFSGLDRKALLKLAESRDNDFRYEGTGLTRGQLREANQLLKDSLRLAQEKPKTETTDKPADTGPKPPPAGGEPKPEVELGASERALEAVIAADLARWEQERDAEESIHAGEDGGDQPDPYHPMEHGSRQAQIAHLALERMRRDRETDAIYENWELTDAERDAEKDATAEWFKNEVAKVTGTEEETKRPPYGTDKPQSLARVSRQGKITLDEGLIEEDWNGGLAYLRGESPHIAGTEQKKRVFADINIDRLREILVSRGGLQAYKDFILAHEKAHRKLHLKLPTESDKLSEESIRREREANNEAFKELGIDLQHKDVEKTSVGEQWLSLFLGLSKAEQGEQRDRFLEHLFAEKIDQEVRDAIEAEIAQEYLPRDWGTSLIAAIDRHRQKKEAAKAAETTETQEDPSEPTSPRDPMIGTITRLADVLTTIGVQPEVVNDLVEAINADIRHVQGKHEQSQMGGMRFEVVTRIKTSIENVLKKHKDLADAEQEIGTDGAYVQPFIGSAHHIANRIFENHLYSRDYNTGEHEESLIIDAARGGMRRHTGTHPVSGKRLDIKGQDSYLSKLGTGFGRILGFVRTPPADRRTGIPRDPEEATFYGFFGDRRRAGEDRAVARLKFWMLSLWEGGDGSRESGLRTTVTRVISGGQTGIDQIGLRVASELGIETGGTAPKGYRVDRDWMDERVARELLEGYGLEESGSKAYLPRTKKNIDDADGTVIFAVNTNSAGTRATVKYADSQNHPYKINPDAEQLREFIATNNIKVLNVAGNRASGLAKKTGAAEKYASVLAEALRAKPVDRRALPNRPVQAIENELSDFFEGEGRYKDTSRDPSLQESEKNWASAEYFRSIEAEVEKNTPGADKLLRLLSELRIATEEGNRAIAGVVGTDSSHPVAIFMPREVLRWDADRVDREIIKLEKQIRGLAETISDDLGTLSLDLSSLLASTGPNAIRDHQEFSHLRGKLVDVPGKDDAGTHYKRMVIGLDMRLKELLGDNYHEQLVETRQLDTAAKLVKRFKIIASRGKGLDLSGFFDKAGKRKWPFLNKLPFVLAEEPAYDGRKDSLDGYVAVEHELWNAMSQAHAWEPGVKISKDFLHDVDPKHGAMGMKGALHRATDAEQEFLKNNNVRLIIYKNAAKYWGLRTVYDAVHSVSEDGKYTMHLHDSKGKEVNPESLDWYTFNPLNLRHLYSEHPHLLKSGTVATPRQLLGMVHTLIAGGGDTDVFNETLKFFKGTTGDLLNMNDGLKHNRTETLLKIVKGLGLDVDLSDLTAEEHDLLEISSDNQRRIDMARDGMILYSKANRRTVDKKIRSAILRAFVRAKVGGAQSYLYPMHRFYEKDIEIGLVDGKPRTMRQDEILMPKGAEDHPIIINNKRTTLRMALDENKQDPDNVDKQVWVVAPRVPIQSQQAVASLRVVGFVDTGTGAIVHPDTVKRVLAGDHDGDKIFVMSGLPQRLIQFMRDKYNAYDENGIPTQRPIVPGESRPVGEEDPTGELAKLSELPAPRETAYYSPLSLLDHTISVNKSKESLSRLVAGAQRVQAVYRHMLDQATEHGLTEMVLSDAVDYRIDESTGEKKKIVLAKFSVRMDLDSQALRYVAARIEQGINFFADAQPSDKDAIDYLYKAITDMFTVTDLLRKTEDKDGRFTEKLQDVSKSDPEFRDRWEKELIVRAFSLTVEGGRFKELIQEAGGGADRNLGTLFQAAKDSRSLTQDRDPVHRGSLIYSLISEAANLGEQVNADMVNPTRLGIVANKWKALAYTARSNDLPRLASAIDWVKSQISGEASPLPNNMMFTVNLSENGLGTVLADEARRRQIEADPAWRDRSRGDKVDDRHSGKYAKVQSFADQWMLLAGKLAQHVQLLKDGADPAEHSKAIELNNEMARLVQLLWLGVNKSEQFSLEKVDEHGTPREAPFHTVFGLLFKPGDTTGVVDRDGWRRYNLSQAMRDMGELIWDKHAPHGFKDYADYEAKRAEAHDLIMERIDKLGLRESYSEILESSGLADQVRRDMVIEFVQRLEADHDLSPAMRNHFRLALMTPMLVPKVLVINDMPSFRFEPRETHIGYQWERLGWGEREYEHIVNSSKEMFDGLSVATPSTRPAPRVAGPGSDPVIMGIGFGGAQGGINKQFWKDVIVRAASASSGLAGKSREFISGLLDTMPDTGIQYGRIRTFLENAPDGHPHILRSVLATRYAMLTGKSTRDSKARELGLETDDFSFRMLYGDGTVARDLRATAVGVINQLEELHYTDVGSYTLRQRTGDKMVLTPNGLARIMDSGSGVAKYLEEDDFGNLVETKTSFILPGTKKPGGWFSFLTSSMAGTPAAAFNAKTIMLEGSEDGRLLSAMPFSARLFKSIGSVFGVKSVDQEAITLLGSKDPTDYHEMDRLAWHIVKYSQLAPLIGTGDMRSVISEWLGAEHPYEVDEVEEASRKENATRLFPRAYDPNANGGKGGWRKEFLTSSVHVAKGWMNDHPVLAEFVEGFTRRTDAANRVVNERIVKALKNHLIGMNSGNEIFKELLNDALYEADSRLEDIEVVELDPRTGGTRTRKVQHFNSMAGTYSIDIEKVREAGQRAAARETDGARGEVARFKESIVMLQDAVKKINSAIQPLYKYKREAERPTDAEGTPIEAPTLADWIFFGRPYTKRDLTDDINEARRTDQTIRLKLEVHRKDAIESRNSLREDLKSFRRSIRDGSIVESPELEAMMITMGFELGQRFRDVNYWDKMLDQEVDARQLEAKHQVVSGLRVSAGRVKDAVPHSEEPTQMELEPLHETILRGFDPDNPGTNRLVANRGLMHDWESYVDNISEALPVGLAEARGRVVSDKLPTIAQKTEAERLIRIGSGDPIRHLLTQWGIAGIGMNVDFGETAMLGRVNIPIKAFNELKKAINKSIGKKVLKLTDLETTFDKQKYWSEMDGMLAVIRFLSSPSTWVNNVAAVKNSYVFLGEKNPFSGGRRYKESSFIRREVDKVIKRGNHGATIGSVIDDLNMTSSMDNMHPYVREILESAKLGADISIGKQMAAWSLIFGIGLPGVTNPIATLALSPLRLNSLAREMLKDPDSRKAHRALIAKSPIASFFITHSESFARRAAWSPAAADYIHFMKAQNRDFLNPEGNQKDYERDQLLVIDYANRYTDLTNYIFNQWGQPEFFKTSLGRMAGRFRSWMPQEHELMLRIFGSKGLTPDGGLGKTVFGSPVNLGLLTGKQYGHLEEIQQRWARAQALALSLSVVPRIMGSLGVSPGMVGMFNYGVFNQFSGGFGRNMNSPTIEAAFMSFDVAQALMNLYYADDEEELENAIAVFESMGRMFGNANLSTAVVSWFRLYAMLMDREFRGSELARGYSGMPMVVGVGAASLGELATKPFGSGD